ncbi:MAG TPA: thioredoxin family protein [Pirellulales bacterium]|nr:thioredoxin family protein [Pirellulales bacterium]
MSSLHALRFPLAVLVVLCALRTATAQQGQLGDILTGKPLSGRATAGADTPASVISVSAVLHPAAAGRPTMLSVTAKVAHGWHIYSLTQKPVEAEPTTITLDKSDDYRLSGDFRPDLPPQIRRRGDVVFEEYESEATWQAPVELRAGVDPRNVKVSGRARIQTCQDNRCLPPHVFEFTAALADASSSKSGTPGMFSDPNNHATIVGHVEPKVVAPGGQVKLVLEARPAEGWHIYELANRDTGALGYKPTLVVITNSSGFHFNRPTASAQPRNAPSEIPGLPAQRYYEQPVSWSLTITIPKATRPGTYPIAGLMGYQTCNVNGCDLPRGARFEGSLIVGAAEASGSAPLVFTDAKYGEAAKLAEAATPAGETQVAQIADVAPVSSLPMILAAALLGGFILNFMPCVLPVIGLKILSFAEQAGHSRSHILMLNVWYSLGVMSVFTVLATLASVVNLGWGQQFSSTSFNVVMVAVVFVMALSFLDVWEIPIPGFVGSGAAVEAAAQGGATGAFFKGVLATVLATPCSGPLLGPVLGFTLNQPPHVTFMIFAAVGLGMSSPYLLIGTFPQLIRFLPKPGAWMDTFKQMLAFVLLGTIVFLLTIINRDYVVPTFAMMVGLWAACWWIGRRSPIEPFSRRLGAWAQGAVFAAVVGYCAFHWLTPRESIIPWKSFSRSELAKLTDEGHTVLVDFTADWCLTCKVNLHFAIETNEVKSLIAANGVVPLLADWTDGSSEIKDALEALHSNSIPVLAIYPADKPGSPIVLRDVISKQAVLTALSEAGPSKLGASAKVAAATALP